MSTTFVRFQLLAWLRILASGGPLSFPVLPPLAASSVVVRFPNPYIDIHRKPGYDPVELFFDPATKSIPLDATLVRGSHGAPATSPNQRTALLCSQPTQAIEPSRPYRDTDMKRIVMDLLGTR